MKARRCFTLILLTFVILAFQPNSFAQDDSPELVVQVIYFHPNDREPQADIETVLDTLMKDVQQFYADEMERHGFGRKTFRLEIDENDQLIVHRVKGRFGNMHYYNAPNRTAEAEKELSGPFDSLKNNIRITWLDLFDPFISLTQVRGSAGVNLAAPLFGGFVRTGATNFETRPGSFYSDARLTLAHELGHAFGLLHDFRNDQYIMSYGDPAFRDQLSYCAAEWLDAHPYFNTTQPFAVFDALSKDLREPYIELVSSSLVSPPNTIRLQFEIFGGELHQAQLLTNSFSRGTGGWETLLDCKSLNANSTGVEIVPEGQHDYDFYPWPITRVEFVTTELLPATEYVTLRVIGNNHQYISFGSQRFPIDVTSLLPRSEPVLIPDKNLAALIRKNLGLPPRSPITKLDMLGLGRLYYYEDDPTIGNLTPPTEKQITDLTGLQHATNLQRLNLNENQIVDLTPVKGLTQLRSLSIIKNKISDLRPLAGLTQLSGFWIWGNPIKDISPLAGLTNLTTLIIGGNQISDISSLVELTNLRNLSLSTNQISDITPLAGLTKLEYLNLWNNQISDASPLGELTNLGYLNLVGNPIKNRKPLLALLKKNPNAKIFLKNSDEPLPVTLSYFRAELTDTGVNLKWTTESEIDNAGFYIYRSQTRYGTFKVVNPTLIQGAGTTSERNEYTWTDTTAKPNTVYYYRIEDISHAGVRKQLATVRMRGFVSASGKLTTRWADLKVNN